MSGFDYRDGVLHIEDVPLTAIAADVGTPAYCYSQTLIEERYRSFAAALEGRNATICYALKANGNLAVVRALAAAGAGADVVSEGELRRAIAAGVDPGRVVYSGVGKTDDEMVHAIETGVRQINVESIPEIEALSRVASDLGRIADIAIRVNPDVDARTHEKIATGKRENKFGIDLRHVLPAARLAADLPGLRLVGLAVHIGSQLTDLQPFRDAFEKVARLARDLRGDGFAIERLDLGGGLGVSYDGETPPDFDAYVAMVDDALAGLDVELTFEPGRSLVAAAGVLLTRILYLKHGETRNFAIVDAAMNDLLRPTMYDAHHPVRPVDGRPRDPAMTVDIVGPVCETGDRLALGRTLAAPEAGDLLAIGMAGAYGAVMASTYNARPLVPEVLVREADFAVVRPRQSYDAMLGQDCYPTWMEERELHASAGR